MSIPRDLLDQLLTGYLDDALNVDERAQVEQLLESDAEVVEELAQLQQLRQSLKAIARADSDIKLDDGFADRVLDAAVARASAEGLGEDHPLLRLAEQPSTTAPLAAAPKPWRVAAVMVALAASIAFAFFALRPDAPPDPGFEIAEVDPDSAVRPVPVPDEVPVPEEIRQDNQTPDEAIASSQQDVQPDSTSDENVSPVAPREAIVESDVPKMGTVDENLVMGIGPIMVLHVERTEAGRQSRAVVEAMRLAALPSTSKKEITEAMAGFVSRTQEKADESTLLYLHAPVKNLDIFYLRLMSDEEGIKSIGMSLATKVPVLKMVEALKAEPTEVRHVGSSMELLSDEGVVQYIVNELRQLEVAPMGDAKDLIPTERVEGPDELSQVLVLIR